jgi:hypothetical protein
MPQDPRPEKLTPEEVQAAIAVQESLEAARLADDAQLSQLLTDNPGIPLPVLLDRRAKGEI